jgi:cell division septation protein DedD
MSDEATIQDDQSHYEISLTAGQAFLAFVLLLLSLAASFTFGLMIGKGQDGDRLVVRKEPAVINEASVIPKKTDGGRIVELGVSNEDFKKPAAATETPTPVSTITEGAAPVPPPDTPAPAALTPAPVAAAPTPTAGAPIAAPPAQPAYAQLLSSSDQKTAEALAAKLIGGGFTSAYVDRATSDKGPIFRVRVKFASESDARAAESKLREYAKDVWITK